MNLLLIAVFVAAAGVFAFFWCELIIRVINGEWSMLRGCAMDPHHEYRPTGKVG